MEVDMGELKDDIKLDDKIVDKFHPCIKWWLSNAWNNRSGCNYKARYYFVIYCSTRGLSPSQTNSLAKKYFSRKKRDDSFKNDYNHFKKVLSLKYGYDTSKLMMNCRTCMLEGLCPGKCKYYQENNFPLYKKRK